MSRTLEEITKIEERTDKNGKIYYRTHGVAGGDSVIGFGNDYHIGDSVMVFFDDRYNMAKMEKLKPLDLS